MAKRPRIVYFDTNILIYILKDYKETREPGTDTIVHEMYQAAGRGQLTIVISAIGLCELWKSGLDPAQRARMHLLDRQHFQIPSVEHPETTRMLDVVQAHYNDNPQLLQGFKLCTNDGIHLATAMHAQAEYLYTFDKNDKGECRGFKKLNGTLPGNTPLRIVEPHEAPAIPVQAVIQSQNTP